MDREKLIQRLMAIFLGELEEHVASLNRDLLALEKEPPPDVRAPLLQALFRTAHSLKGAARSVNVTLIEAACHQLEELLAEARDRALVFDRDLFRLLFEAVDAIEEASARLRAKQELAGSPLEAILPRLIEAATLRRKARGSASLPAPAPAPAPAPTLTSAPAPAPTLTSAPAPAHTLTSAPAPSFEAPRVEAPRVEAPVVAAAPISTRASSGPPSTVLPMSASLRVAAEKLDSLLLRSGELLAASRRMEAIQEPILALQQLVSHCRAEGRDTSGAGAERAAASLALLERDLLRIAGTLASDCRALGQAASALDEDVRRVRMLPFAEACQGLTRIARDVAKESGKDLELTVEGGNVELDRAVLEALKDPLVHLVRNAVDHGVETPGERRVAGKRPRAVITIACALRGNEVEVTVSDDGRGLDVAAIRSRAKQQGLPDPPDERATISLLFLPGFSTSPRVTALSGRGVGLDIVKTQVESLHGSVDVSHRRGSGTRFAITVPLTLTTIRAVLLAAGGQIFAVSSTNVRRLLRVGAEDLRSVDGRDVVVLGGVVVPVASLEGALGLTRRERASSEGKLPVVVVASGHQQMALVVDELVAEQEILVKSLGKRLRRAPNVSGATVLPSGRVALILNAAELLRTALGRSSAPLLEASRSPRTARKKRLLIADDSVTTRSLEKTILESAGYEVTAAADGVEALRLLEERGADLVVSDVEMPRMDGFSLTEAIRASARFHALPVILVTGLDSDADKARGIKVGADAYLVKSAFDQTSLLDTIAQLL